MTAIGGSARLINAAAVADLLGVSKATVYDRHREWQLPTYRIGQALRFKERDVLAWIERRRIAA